MSILKISRIGPVFWEAFSCALSHRSPGLGQRKLVITHISIGSRFWETSLSSDACFSVYLLRFRTFSKPLGGAKPYLARVCGRFGGDLWDPGNRLWELGVVDMGVR